MRGVEKAPEYKNLREIGASVSASSKELAQVNPVPPVNPEGAGSALDLDQSDAEGESGAAGEAPLDLEEILSAVRETAYRWDFASDRIDWAANAEAVLGVADGEKIAKGRALALLVDPEQAGARYDGITGSPHVAPDTELHYCLRYRFLPEGRRGRAALWVEDTGVCSFDVESRPRAAQGTLRVINDRREREERLLYLGSHDELTGQLNRTRLTEELTRFLGSAGRSPAKGAFLLAGVNDLTLVNETYGYDVGDEVITIVGRRIGRALRGKDCIGRFSSNKFGIVLQDCGEEGVRTIAGRLMAAVRDSVIDTAVGAVATSISVGAVLLPDNAGNSQAALGRALQALDVARSSRSDRFSLYQSCERRDSERRRAVAIADEIVRALDDRRMILALALKALGCRVALDDFGAGYTSLRSLRLLGVGMVKIDGSFIQNLGTQAEDELFVRTLIELARSFGITTVGE